MQTPDISQVSSVLAALYKQMTGIDVPAPLDLSGFISTATAVFNLGLDKVHNAIWNMVGETIIAIRPYQSRFADMEFDTTSWGIVDRKISYLSRLPMDSQAYKPPVTWDTTAGATNPSGDGESVDMYKINKDKIVQTAFYGQETYSYTRTRFAEQLKTAFRGPEEFAKFLSGAVTSLNNDRELWKEGMRRGLLINAIGALYEENASSPRQTGRVVHLLNEYNTETGLSLTAQTVRQPANFDPFIKWVYARMGDLKARFAENNILFTTQFDSRPLGYGILRHTDAENLRIKISAPFINRMRAGVLANTYNPEMLSLDGVEPVAYWQSPSSPFTVQVRPVYTSVTGSEIAVDDEDVIVSSIFGIMYDKDFVGCANIMSDVSTTPFNTKGRYWNDDYIEVYKTRFDMTEKAVLLLLD